MRYLIIITWTKEKPSESFLFCIFIQKFLCDTFFVAFVLVFNSFQTKFVPLLLDLLEKCNLSCYQFLFEFFWSYCLIFFLKNVINS